MTTITFHNYNVSLNLKNKTALKEHLRNIFRNEGTEAKSINYIFCTDNYLLELNQQYLNHDTYTDILTFTLNSENEPIVSEIYISIHRTKENASLHNTDPITELHRVMIHGVLHLCGYKDETPAEKEEMRQKEDFYLSQLRFT